MLVILGLMVIPVPAIMLDLMLTFSISFSVTVLLVALYLKEPLQFNSFPSLLLILTLMRLSLNVASTRLILSKGSAGQVIQSFGDFVVGGNYVIGVIVFIILVIINFMVITKGSGRIAEVAARFTLDAMPGKQMAIDADLNAGIINEKEAVRRREKISQEAEFFGAMDGASKFVKGDAIAGILITVVNLAAGFIIGMLQMGMSASEALSRFTVLTVGDGLVSQIPALLVSTSAGMVVTRSSSKLNLGQSITLQIFRQTKALYLAAVAMLVFAIIPGLPTGPFLFFAIATGLTGLFMGKRVRDYDDDEARDAEASEEADQTRDEEPEGAAQRGSFRPRPPGTGNWLRPDSPGGRLARRRSPDQDQQHQTSGGLGTRDFHSSHPRPGQPAARGPRVRHQAQGCGGGPVRTVAPIAFWP